ncbi:MAG: site-specific integrase [Deltaproteobacteria bacterium]|nr:site-specific integrase [Deltaproteobacteria bacterium]
MKKMFADAIELFQILSTNPVLKKMRSRLSQKEARYLNLEQLKTLLTYVREKPYGLAVWLSAYLGLRVGEVQALRWEDVDLQTGVLHIRRTYSKHESVFRDYPKGRKQHSHQVPQELLYFLKEVQDSATGELVIVPAGWKMLDYWMYRKVLQQYCEESGVPVIATHGLRHSTSELYQTYGASRDDLRQLFAHSSGSTTERYIHHKSDSLEKVAKVIQLFPREARCSHNVPISNSESKEGGVSH